MNAIPMNPTGRAQAGTRHEGRVTQLRVIRSEMTKLWSLRSTRWSLLLAAITMTGLGPLIAAVRMTQVGSTPDRQPLDPIGTSLAGWVVAQLAIGVLGVLIVSGEYSTGTIRSTFTTVPRRLPVLWAKIVVFGTTTFLLMLPCAFVAFFATQAILSGHHLETSLGQPNVLRAIVGTALFLAVTAVFGAAFGALLRRSAGAIATFAAMMFVLSGVGAILPASWTATIDPYLPLNAGSAVINTQPAPGSLGPWTGLAVYALYAAIVTVAAAILLVRRDA